MPLEHAILAILDFGPQTGYDIKKVFDRSVAHFWSSTQSHIYKALEQLESKGFAESHVIPQQGKPNRKEYKITKSGRSEFRKWLTTPLPLGPVREPWLVQLFFAHSLENEQIAELLKARKSEINKVVDELLQVQAIMGKQKYTGSKERMSALWNITIDYGIDYYKAEIAWLEKTISRLRHLPPMVSPK